MSDKIYKKVGTRYKEIGHEFTGFPVDGVWLVKDGSNNCIMRLHEIGQGAQITALPYLELVEEALQHCTDALKDSTYTLVELVQALAKFYAKKAEQSNTVNVPKDLVQDMLLLCNELHNTQSSENESICTLVSKLSDVIRRL